MSYDFTFRMTVEAKEQSETVMEIIKSIFEKNGFETVADSLTLYENDEIESCPSYAPDTEGIEERMEHLYKEFVLNLPNVNFHAFAGYCWGSMDSEFWVEKQDNKVDYGMLLYEGRFSCEECGEDLLTIEEFNPEKVYVCPECGEKFTASELFSWFDKRHIVYELKENELEVVERKVIQL